jgi:hypothetical protein
MLRLTPVVLVFIALGLRIQAAPIISPDGTAYSSYTASSELNGSYTVDNLFDQNPTVGQEISTGGSDAGFAYGGAVDVTPLYVEFQLDSIYVVQSLFYAQRDFNNGHNPGFDKIGTIDLWASTTTPFTASDPSTTPDATVSITNLTDDTYLEYQLSAPVTGQYFLIRLTAASGQGASVFGGTEFRLGGAIPEPSSAALLIATAAAGLAWRRWRNKRSA